MSFLVVLTSLLQARPRLYCRCPQTTSWSWSPPPIPSFPSPHTWCISGPGRLVALWTRSTGSHPQSLGSAHRELAFWRQVTRGWCILFWCDLYALWFLCREAGRPLGWWKEGESRNRAESCPSWMPSSKPLQKPRGSTSPGVREFPLNLWVREAAVKAPVSPSQC